MADWEVFARSELNAPIRHVGTVAADRPEDADVFAWKLYDEWTWKEMFIAPRSELVRVHPVMPDHAIRSERQLLFGRQGAGDLFFLGDLEPGRSPADAAAIRHGETWSQMMLIPASAIRWVRGPAALATRG